VELILAVEVVVVVVMTAAVMPALESSVLIFQKILNISC
jgi:hypothetical protein